MNLPHVIGIALVMGVSGCATTRDCDPRYDPGFIGSINCHASDAYQGRVVESQKILANEQELKAELARQSREVHETRLETDASLREAEADLANMDGQVDEMEAALKRAGKTNKTLQAKLASCRGKIAHLQKGMKKGNAQTVERNRLRSELDKARKELLVVTGAVP
jgi:chromosome segregation ATPase